jgi:hypothetical protein
MDAKDAIHIATFDPPTVKALIAELHNYRAGRGTGYPWKQRDQLKARVAEMENKGLEFMQAWDTQSYQLEAKTAQVEAWEKVAEQASSCHTVVHECDHCQELITTARGLSVETASEKEGGS